MLKKYENEIASLVAVMIVVTIYGFIQVIINLA